VEASAIPVGPGLGRPRIAIDTPLLRLRSDEQLVRLFREGNEDAFRVIHDRYRARLLAYVRQMLPGRPADAEDALQDILVRAYAGLRTSERELALRPWLYRVAHNHCIDELRRPQPILELREAQDRVAACDPAIETEQRESLRRLVVDIGRLPEQQRSALLMRELSGMAYADVAAALGVSVPAVKSLLVRARIGLVQAIEARDATCVEIRQELASAHDQGVRPSWMARRHLRDCPGCRASRAEMRVSSRQVAALVPALGPLAALAKLLGIGTGAGGGGATAAGAGTAGAGGAATGAGGAAAGGALGAGTTGGLAGITVGHVATVLAAAVVTAGSAVAVQQTVATPAAHHHKHAVHHGASAPAGAVDAALRVPPKPTITGQPATSQQSSHAHRALGAGASAGTPAAAAQGAAHHYTPTRLNDVEDMSGAPSASANPTTCTPPPTACTASDTTTCASDPGSTTAGSAQDTSGTGTTTSSAKSGSGTTGSGTTGTGTTGSDTAGSGTASTDSSRTGSGTTTGTASGSTSGTTTGATTGAASTTTGAASTTTGAGATTMGAACSTTTPQGIGTQSTQMAAADQQSGQSDAGQAATPTSGTGQTDPTTADEPS
jgi:RNA polymerase sigma factor (sigma-70 family)